MSIAQTFTVTVAGGKYYIDGVQQDTVMIGAGLTYKFDQSDGTNGNHPLRFSTNDNNSPSAPYTTGVTTSGVPGNSGAYTQIEVTAGAPSTLYYYCSNHSGMGGQANTDGWGRSYWGQMDWGDTNVVETGWGRKTWGYQSWGDTPIITLTGLTATTSLGIPDELIELRPGWGTLNWGENGWGSVESAVENLVGLSATTSLGTVIAKDVVGLTGLSATSSIGSFNFTSDPTIAVSGQSATTTVGSLTPADIMGLTGQSSTSAVGSVTQTIFSGANLDGLGLTATTSVNGDRLILKYFQKLDPKTSTGYTQKTPKNTTGYSIKTPA